MVKHEKHRVRGAEAVLKGGTRECAGAGDTGLRRGSVRNAWSSLPRPRASRLVRNVVK